MYASLALAISILTGSVLAAPEGNPEHIFRRGKCNADNCFRAVDGTRRGPSFPATATSDCSAFLRSTVTPSPLTRIVSVTTVITLPTQYITEYVDAPTQVQVPSYASACSGSVRYASACSCAGISADVTTLPPSYTEITYTDVIYQTPITTVTITESSPVITGSSSSFSYHYDSTSSYSYSSYNSESSTFPTYSQQSSTFPTYSQQSSTFPTYSQQSSTFPTYSSQSSTTSSSPAPGPTFCSTYQFKATTGNFKDWVLKVDTDVDFSETLSFTPDDLGDSRFIFTIQPDGQVRSHYNGGVWKSQTPSTNSTLVYAPSANSPLNTADKSPIVCALGQTSRELLCLIGHTPTVLETCGYDNARLAQGTDLGFQCDKVGVVAVPACI